MSTIKEIVFSKATIEFATVAKEYCTFIESATTFKRSQFVKVCHSLLPLLYYKASLLPATEPVSEMGNVKHVTEEYYLALEERLKIYLGEHDAFPGVFDPNVAETDEPFAASIAEYLSDVYQDLKDFTMLYQKGQEEEMNDALWECRLNFKDYWGIRLANAIRAFHMLAYGDADLDEYVEQLPKKGDDSVDTDAWFITRRQRDMLGEEL